ncbi:MAG TPA: HD domain-containing phosphohydrolase [Rectinemataceae bacterium]|nr:HD domain-containing phosphohydrolase [Rectinemataceae bacterium]
MGKVDGRLSGIDGDAGSFDAIQRLLRAQPEAALSLASDLFASGSLSAAEIPQACALAAFAAVNLGDQELGETWARRGLEAEPADRAIRGRLLASLGISLHQRGSFSEANRILGSALSIARRSRDPESLIRALANVGIARSESSRDTEALPYLREALGIAIAHRGTQPFDSLALQVRSNLALALVGCDRNTEALGEIEATIEESRRVGDSLTLCFALYEKGIALDAIGSRHEARECLVDSLSFATLFGLNLTGVRAAALLARYHVDSGELDNAESILDQWLPIAATSDSLRHAALLRLRGRVLALRGRWQEAYYESERASAMELSGGACAAAAASLARSHGTLKHRARVLTDRIEGWSEAVVHSLAYLIDARDGPTGDHMERSSLIVGILGELLIARGAFPRFGRTQLDRIVQLSPLHDVGKVAVPDDILRKPGPLDAEERLLMQRHAMVGREVFLDAAKATRFDPLAATAAEIAGSHHERWNGEGYPEGLAGTDIPLSARIVALADVYDAIRSERPYKAMKSHEEASDYIISSAGSHFDPLIVEAFAASQGRIASIYSADA